jgi:parvulin-like peptidyl-prolyl isomerase
MKRTIWLGTAVGLAALALGCGLQPQPLAPSAFVRPPRPAEPNVQGQPIGQSGALAYGELHPPLLPDEYSNRNAKPPPGISPEVRQDIPAPGEGVGTGNPPASTTQEAAPTSEPAAPGVSQGYQWVGTVVATVDTTPIFADKVLALLDHELAAEAHKFPPATFRQVARQDIEAKVQDLIQNQLEIERANASLSQDAKTQAQLYAQVWRRQQITAAGGSEAIARQRALENGEPFDDQINDQYHIAMVQLYYQQRVAPKIQVTASDMRRYYAQHMESEFTKHAEAKYRLIRVDFVRSGGAEKAAEKADKIIKDLKDGANFEEEARKYNDDPYLMNKGGDMGWMQKGGFKFDNVEEAVWALQPGQFTDKPIEVSDRATGNAFYIGLLEQRRGGTVQRFDNPAVQKVIYDRLFSQQLAGLRERELNELIKNAVILRASDGINIAVDMAMQRYPVWAEAR